MTAEKHKGKYVYYHCTQYKTECGQPWVKEETLDEHAKELTQLLRLGDNGLAYMQAALKKSLSEKREWQDKSFNALVREQEQLKKRMDNMYEDRLDRKISEELYNEKFKQYTERLDELEIKISRHNRADVNYYEFGRKILELAENAEMLLKQAEPDEQRELLQYLLSNSTLKDGKPSFGLKLPFDAIAKHAPSGTCPTWQG